MRIQSFLRKNILLIVVVGVVLAFVYYKKKEGFDDVSDLASAQAALGDATKTLTMAQKAYALAKVKLNNGTGTLSAYNIANANYLLKQAAVTTASANVQAALAAAGVDANS